MVDGVVEAPGGAHFTSCVPDYGRDEAFQAEYAASAASPQAWQRFRAEYLSGDEAAYQEAVGRFRTAAAPARRPRHTAVRHDGDPGMTAGEATRAEVCVVACAEAWRGDGEILASPMGLIPGLGARLARLTFAPDLLLSDGEAYLLAGRRDRPPPGRPAGV